MTTPAVRGRAKHGAAAMVSVLLLAGCNSSTDVAVDAAPPNEPPYQKTMEVAELEFELVRAARETYEDQPGAPELVTAEARYKDYLTNSHIHAAYGIYDCAQSAGAEWLEPINGTGDEDTVGIHAHDDGLIHAHPFSERAAGKNAVLQLFLTVTGISVTSNRIYVPVKVGYVDYDFERTPV